jgi:release factor glutamine methyltransferase
MSATRWILGDLLRVTAEFLGRKGSPSPRLDADLLMTETLGLPGRVALFTQLDRPLIPSEVDAFREQVRRRAAGEPMAYILGRRHFWKEELEVTRATLIPRPETEALVEAALAVLPDDSQALCVDLGTGTGAIAIALARERPGLTVLASDVSPEALAVARRNVARHGLEERVTLVQSDLLQELPLDRPIDLLVSNPPYVATEGHQHLLEPAVLAFEPHLALFGGPDGLEVVRRILSQAAPRLAPRAHLLLEVGLGQAPLVAVLPEAAPYQLHAIHKDLSGIERVVELRLTD